jgi:hypothetical protein
MQGIRCRTHDSKVCHITNPGLKGTARLENRILEDHDNTNNQESSSVTKRNHEIRLQAVEIKNQLSSYMNTKRQA